MTNDRVHSTRWHRSRCNRRGAILALAACLMIVVLGVLAFAIDVGRVVSAKADLQNAADAAAYSAARRLGNDPEMVRKAAARVAMLNQVAGTPVTLMTEEDVEIGNWDSDTATFTLLTGAAENQGNAVRVTCRRSAGRSNSLPLFFAPLLGTSHSDVSAFAIATSDPAVCGLIIGLDKFDMSGGSHTDSYRSEYGPYDPATARLGGHACSNTEIKMSGSSAIGGDAHPGPGNTVNSSSSIGVLGSIEPLTEPIVLQPIDPGDAATNNNNADIPLSDEGKQPLDGSGKFVLSGSDHVALPPGVYYFYELTLSGSSSITIYGETIFYVENKVRLSGGTLTNATQLPTNLQIYCMGSDVDLSGDSALYAAVYAPTAKVVRSGDADFYGMAIGREISLSGSGGIHVDESLDLLAGTDCKAKLVQ